MAQMIHKLIAKCSKFHSGAAGLNNYNVLMMRYES